MDPQRVLQLIAFVLSSVSQTLKEELARVGDFPVESLTVGTGVVVEGDLTLVTFNNVKQFIRDTIWTYISEYQENFGVDIENELQISSRNQVFDVHNRNTFMFFVHIEDLIAQNSGRINNRLVGLYQTYKDAMDVSYDHSQDVFDWLIGEFEAKVIYHFVSSLPVTAFRNHNEYMAVLGVVTRELDNYRNSPNPMQELEASIDPLIVAYNRFIVAYTNTNDANLLAR